MTLYALDTDNLSLLQRGHPVVRVRCAAKSPPELAITSISVEEQLSGRLQFMRTAIAKSELAGGQPPGVTSRPFGDGVKSLGPNGADFAPEALYDLEAQVIAL